MFGDTPEVQRLLDEAASACERADYDTAVRCGMRVIQMHPQHAEAHYLVGRASLDGGQLQPALEHLNRAVSINTENAEYDTHFARALVQAQRYGQALQVANIAYPLTPADPRTLIELGGVYMSCNAHERAHVVFRKAMELLPDDANCRFNAAVTSSFLGELDAAEALFDTCIELEPDLWPAYGLRSRLRRQTGEDNHVDSLETLLAAHSEDTDACIHLHGALGKEYEDLGDYARAFEHMSRGKAAARPRVNYRPEQDSALVDALIEAFPDPVTSNTGYGSDEPIFVVGMPRSGTTLVERILSSHPHVYSAGELMDFGVQLGRLAPASTQGRLDAAWAAQANRYDWSKLGLLYVDGTRPQTAMKPRFIDKLPYNFMYLGLIARALPRARIICLRRHPLDTCLSNFRESFDENSSFHRYSFDLLDIGRFYVQFDRLMSHWKRVLPQRILEVGYETLVSEPEPVTRQLLEFCHLPWNDACLEFHRNASAVATASTSQVREPLHDRAVGRWERYRPWLGPLMQLLQEAGMDISGTSGSRTA
jgi:tetratricopeptide (TPR) repeat protein